MRAEADNGILAVHGLDERLKRALEIGHRDPLVDDKALDLVEHGGVRRVDLVLAIHAAGGQNADGRLADGLHGADLHGAGLRAQKDFLVVRHIERVAAVAGGVVLGDIQLGEVIVGKLDLRAVEDLEAHGDKNILGLVERLVHRMPVTQLDRGSGDGHVDGLGLQSGLHGLFFQFGADGFDFFLNGGADVVRGMTGRSSADSLPIVFKTPVSSPFLPRKRTRSASSSPASLTLSSAPSASCRIFSSCSFINECSFS